MYARHIACMAVGVIVLLGCGCAAGNKHPYHGTPLNLSASGRGPVAVATVDQRSYIASGDKQPDFVGLQRAGYGNPFDVRTASKKPLATDMTETISSSLAARGFDARPIVLPPKSDESAARQALRSSGAPRCVLLLVREWKSDTYNNTKVYYDLTLQVLNQNGQLVATQQVQGQEAAGGSLWNPPAAAKKNVPALYRTKLEQMLNSPEVVRALG